MMKFRYLLYISVVLFAACKKDNYDAPNISLKGRVVYNGVPISVEQTVDNPSTIELWQPGFGGLAAIKTPITQDGTFSELLFKGDYKLTMADGNGPWMWKRNASNKPDTVYINLQENKDVDLEVTPYYMVRNVNFSLSNATVNATFDLEKIITDAVNGKDIESVTLYINKTQFVSGSFNVGKTELTSVPSLTNINLSVSIPTLVPTQNYIFARIGVRIAGVSRLLFSPVQKLTF